MRLNAVIFSLLLACLSPAARAQGAETARRDSASTRYEKMAERRMATWQKLIPDHYKTQFAAMGDGLDVRLPAEIRERASQAGVHREAVLRALAAAHRAKPMGRAAPFVQPFPLVGAEREVLDARARPLSQGILWLLHPHQGQPIAGAAHHVRHPRRVALAGAGHLALLRAGGMRHGLLHLQNSATAASSFKNKKKK